MNISRVDAVELAIYAVIAAFFGYLSLESVLTTPVWAIALLFVSGVTTVLLRRRSPAVSAGLAFALLPLSTAFGTGAEALLVIVTLLRAGSSQSARRAWALFGISVVVGCAAALILVWRLRLGPPMLGLAPRADSDAWSVEWVSCWAAFTGVALIAALIGVNAGHRRRHIAALVDRSEQLQRERDQQASIARALERERISREMHDVIAHSLSVVISLADGAQAASPEKLAERQQVLTHIADTGRRALGEVSRLLTRVRDDNEEESRHPSLDVEQLPALVNEFVAAGLPVRFERTGALAQDSAVGLTVYRIVQESLTNVLRHARDVRDVRVKIDLRSDQVTILVEDVSAPATRAETPGRGLVGIHERGALYDGDVETGPRDGGRGWRVFVRLRLEG